MRGGGGAQGTVAILDKTVIDPADVTPARVQVASHSRNTAELERFLDMLGIRHDPVAAAEAPERRHPVHHSEARHLSGVKVA